MRSRRLWLALACALAAPPVLAADPVARSYAATCANCHGTDGHAKAPMVALAGLPKEHIVTLMKAFKAGTRPATIMNQIAKGYTDEQIDTIATYFASQKR
jgi:cytochrome c553